MEEQQYNGVRQADHKSVDAGEEDYEALGLRKKRDESRTFEREMAEISHNNKGGDDNSEIQITPEKGVISKDQTIQESEKALRDLLERQTRKVAIAIEAIKRAEEMANRQRVILEEAEKRERLELFKKSNKSLLLKGLISMSFR
ncbi:hypothetical protein PIB30_002569 [Stylosanthes scabra]|uniref:Uncharacterized protein n=1 Tax=Stylosanthes scabra TaxID=79078 RepID=A0ABU6Z0Z9_9FABA|nr:hypothetical protein [Stylosanthes scabra]